MIKLRPVFSVLILAAGLSLPANASILTSSDNPGLEEPYSSIESNENSGEGKFATGEIALGWEEHVSSGQVVFSRETNGPKEGNSCQRINVMDAGSSEVEFGKRLQIASNKSYNFTIWLKADTFRKCRLLLREATTPNTVISEKTVDVTTEWSPFQIQGKIKDGDLEFILSMASQGTLWVDDLEVEEVAATSTGACEGPGNYFQNSSFEAGLGFGWRLTVRPGSDLAKSVPSEVEPPHDVIDDSTAFAGKKSLKISLPTGRIAVLTSPLVSVAGGRDYVASIALKSDIPAKASLSLLDKDGKNFGEMKGVDLTSEWQRASLTENIPPGTSLYFRLTLSSESPANIWIDAAQFEEGKSPSDYSQPKPIELALNTSRPGAIFFDNESVSLDIATGGDIPAGVILKSSVENLMGGTVSLPNLSLPAKQWVIPADSINAQGMFKVRAVVIDATGKELSAPAEKIFARLPHPRDISPERSFFGGHSGLQPNMLAIMHAVGMRWVRLHDTSGATGWAHVEPSRDQFQFSDQGIDAAKAAGLEVLGMLDEAPAWSSVKPRATSGYFSAYNFPDISDGMDRWANYVRETVTHYKGRIHYWEVWNEPWHKGFFLGTPEQYGEILKSAYAAAKEVDPSAQIVGFSAANVEWARAALAVSGTQSYDIFSYHDYNPSLYGGNPNNADHLVSRFTAVQKDFGEAKPLWDTEGGAGNIASWYGTESSTLSPRMQMTHIVRFDVTQFAAGVQRFFFYTLEGGKPIGCDGYDGLEYDGSIRPVLAASAVLASLIDGASFLERTEMAPQVEAFKFRQEDGTVVTVVWANDSNGHDIPVPDGAQAIDILGNPLPGSSIKISAEPIYFITK